MSRGTFRYLILSAASLTLFAGAMTAVSVRQASAAISARAVIISGSLPERAGEVLVLSERGAGWLTRVTDRRFAVRVPDRALLYDATLQVFSASGRYAGPVVLKELPETANTACRGPQHSVRKIADCIDDVIGLGRIALDLNLGSLRGENRRGGLPTWFLAAKATQYDSRDAVRAAARNGRPYGAGNLGLVGSRGIPDVQMTSSKRAAADGRPATDALVRPHVMDTLRFRTSAWVPFITSRELGGHGAHALPHLSQSGADPQAGDISTACPTTHDPADSTTVSGSSSPGTAPGQELDCSGVPNALNADVNGNGILNQSDSAPASIAASGVFFAADIAGNPTNVVSYYAPGGISAQRIDSFLNPTASQPGAGGPFIGGFSGEFGSLFSGGTVPTGAAARIDCNGLAWCSGANLLGPNAQNLGPWAQSAPPYALSTQQSGTFSAQVGLPAGTDVRDAVVAGQTVYIDVSNPSGAPIVAPMTVAPYFVSTPYIENAKFTNVSGNSVMTSDRSSAVRRQIGGPADL